MNVQGLYLRSGQGLGERSSRGLHLAVGGQGLFERASGGLHPAVCG